MQTTTEIEHQDLLGSLAEIVTRAQLRIEEAGLQWTVRWRHDAEGCARVTVVVDVDATAKEQNGELWPF